MRVLSHITLKSKIHLLNYSEIWYTARHPHITEKILELSWDPALHPRAKNTAGAPVEGLEWKLAHNIHRVSGYCWKGFPGRRSVTT